MIFGSVCSGIEAASVAWHPLGWRAAFVSEIEPFPCAVLAHHYPGVPNLGDMTQFKDWPDAAIDLLCGGTPCQSFSVAGLRAGLDDPRGNLMLTFGSIAAKYRPRWLVWENVPGVLSSNGGRDFGAFLGLLGVLGYGFAYRVLDAQYFGLAQRRKRVFVVGCLGDWRRAAAVLFERESLRWDLAPRREARERPPGALGARTGLSIGAQDACAGHLIPERARALTTSNQRIDAETETLLVTHALTGEGFDAGEDGTGRGTPLVPVGVTIHGTDPTVRKIASYDDLAQCLRARTPGNIDNSSTTVVQHPIAFDTTQITSAANRSNPQAGDPCHPLAAVAHAPAIAFDTYNQSATGGITQTLCSRGDTEGGNTHVVPAIAYAPIVNGGMQVRRLTPRECARLQGFPDDYLDILHRGKPAADGPKYRALGNSWAVPVVRWIGRRIEMVDAIKPELLEASA